MTTSDIEAPMTSVQTRARWLSRCFFTHWNLGYTAHLGSWEKSGWTGQSSHCCLPARTPKGTLTSTRAVFGPNPVVRCPHRLAPLSWIFSCDQRCSSLFFWLSPCMTALYYILSSDIFCDSSWISLIVFSKIGRANGISCEIMGSFPSLKTTSP